MKTLSIPQMAIISMQMRVPLATVRFARAAVAAAHKPVSVPADKHRSTKS
jgi:hypothetical protein